MKAKRVSVAEAKDRLPALIHEAEESHSPVEITRRGKVVAVLVSSADYERQRMPKRSVADEIRDIFEKHGVQLTLWGHDHNYERTNTIGGVTYVVTGGGGTGTRNVGSSSFTAFSAEVSHFVYLETVGDELRLWAIDATGQTFDTAIIQQRNGVVR